MMIPSVSGFSCSVILSALLIYKAVQLDAGSLEATRYTSVRNEMLGGVIEWLARVLGLGGAIGFSVVLMVITGIWIVLRAREYRRLVRTST